MITSRSGSALISRTTDHSSATLRALLLGLVDVALDPVVSSAAAARLEHVVAPLLDLGEPLLEAVHAARAPRRADRSAHFPRVGAQEQRRAADLAS
jgi:hypothetical protein